MIFMRKFIDHIGFYSEVGGSRIYLDEWDWKEIGRRDNLFDYMARRASFSSHQINWTEEHLLRFSFQQMLVLAEKCDMNPELLSAVVYRFIELDTQNDIS